MKYPKCSSTYKWIKNVSNQYNGIAIWNTSQKHHAKWKKPAIEDNMISFQNSKSVATETRSVTACD